MLWAARAIAKPPIPRPATKAVISTPILSNANRRKRDHIKNFASLLKPVIAVTLCISLSDFLLFLYFSNARFAIIIAHFVNCQKKINRKNCETLSFIFSSELIRFELIKMAKKRNKPQFSKVLSKNSVLIKLLIVSNIKKHYRVKLNFYHYRYKENGKFFK